MRARSRAERELGRLAYERLVAVCAIPGEQFTAWDDLPVSLQEMWIRLARDAAPVAYSAPRPPMPAPSRPYSLRATLPT